MSTPLCRVILFVFDVESCAQFYVDVFDFKRLPADDPTRWQELETGGCRLAFHKAIGCDGPTGSEDNPHKITFHSHDVALTRERAIAHGAIMGEVKSFGTITLCDGRDVEGHVFQLSNEK